MLLICLAFFLLLCFILLGATYKLIKGGSDPNQGNSNRRTDISKDWKLFVFYIIATLLLGTYLYEQGYDKIVNSLKNDDRPITPYRRE